MSNECSKRFSLLACVLSVVSCAQVADTDTVDSSSDAGATTAGADASSFADAAASGVSMYVHTGDALFRVDNENFDLVEVGSFASSDSMMDMAVTPDGALYTISYNALFHVDASTGVAEPLVDVPYGNVGMTFLPNGTLLAADNAGGVRTIDPISGAIDEIGTFGNGYALAGDLVAVASGTMYGIADEGPRGDEGSSNVLLTVDTATGAAQEVGPIGFSGVFGVAVANDQVYAFTRTGEIVEIDPATGAGVLVRAYPDVSFWGAGVTPRAVINID